jgi:hypothetical protein
MTRASRVERELPMMRKIMIVLAAGAALTAGLSDDAVARPTAHSGWDGLGDGGGHPISSQKTPKPGATPRDPPFGRGIGEARSNADPTNLQMVEAAAVVMRGCYRGPALVHDALEGAARLLARADEVIE